MRIVYITDALAVWGGIERVLSDKMNYLVRECGYEVFVVTADQGNHQIPFPFDGRIHIKDLNIRFHQKYMYHGLMRFLKSRELDHLYQKRLKLLLEEINPDIISCIRDGYASAVLDVVDSIPIIFESHAMFRDIEFEKATIIHRLKIYIKRKKFNKLSQLVALTQGDADDWKKVSDNVCVIPNVVHLNESGKYSHCCSKSAIFVGRFDVQKDFGTLLKIWKLVQERHSDWLLNVYGNGVLKPLFEKEVYDNKLNVNIHPAVDDIFDRYMESSMLLMTSLYEPFGLVLVEAMSCGIPVVAFNCPYGPSDIITDGVDGFIVEDRNIETFANRICQLIENPALRKKMGNEGVKSSKRYCSEQIMPKWIDLFQKLITDIK